MNQIENSFWTEQEKNQVASILNGWNLKIEQQQILREQIKQIKNVQQFLIILCDANFEWQTLQNHLNQSAKECILDGQQNNQEINEPELNSTSEQSNQIQQNVKSVHQDLENTKSEYVNDELRIEFTSLNNKEFTQEFNLVDMVFQILQNPINAGAVFDFANSEKLVVDDLITLCLSVKHVFQFYPRLVQLISVILLYNHEVNHGRLAQIQTGEGKTLIVAMLAVLFCKKRKCNVDIVTSSSIIAKKDYSDYFKFYQYFNLTVGHNIRQNSVTQEGALPCYNCQIIYGDAQSFSVDILQHEYSQLRTMGNRKQQYAIIDEIDSMLLDGHQKTNQLCSPIPGMLDISKLLTLIWQELCKVQEYLSSDFKVMIRDKDNYYSVDLVEYIEKTLDYQFREFLKEFIPHFRLNYIDIMMKTWIKNAITAKFYLKRNREYIVENGVIKIIDFQKGLLLQNNQQFEKGLHQFIQLKHNISITPLCILTICLSNIAYFQRYQEKLIGITSAFGSQNTQNLLAQKYNVDFIFVPRFQKIKIQEYNSKALQNKNEWLSAIYKAVLKQIENKRAVLIINRSIEDAEEVAQIIKKNNFKFVLHIYSEYDEVILRNIGPQEIVITTNKAIKLITSEELESNGGLHVIMSFLPESTRTQDQVLARIRRQGTFQLIVKFQQNVHLNPELQFEKYGDVIEYYKEKKQTNHFNLIDVIKFIRDQSEQNHTQQIKEMMENLEYEAKCFEKYCSIAKMKVNLKQNRQQFRSFEERWGLYQEINKEKGFNIHEIENFLNCEENQNPKYLILEALEQQNLLKIYQARENQNDPYAQYYKGVLLLEKKLYNEAVQSLLQSKQLFQKKIENERGFGLAVQINQQQIQYFQIEDQLNYKQIPLINDFEDLHNFIFFQIPEQIEIDLIKEINNLLTDNRATQKVKNHIKIYQKVIYNLEEILNTVQNFSPNQHKLDLQWVKVSDKGEWETEEQEQVIEDQIEVINDGPLPRLVKIAKMQKTSLWNYHSQYYFEFCQFLIQIVLSKCSFGAAIPLQALVMKIGITTIVRSLETYLKGINTDWYAERQNKSIEYISALCLGGPTRIREAIYAGNKTFSSLKQEDFGQFIKKIGVVSAEELRHLVQSLTQKQKDKVQNCIQTLQQITKIADLNLSLQQTKQIAKDLLREKVEVGSISQDLANDIKLLVEESFNMDRELNGSLKSTLVQMGTKYLKILINKLKVNTMDILDQQEVYQNLVDKCYKTSKQVMDFIEDFKQFKQALIHELNLISEALLDLFQQDVTLQKYTITIDLYLELQCSFEKVQEQINFSSIQQLVHQNLDLNSREFKFACLNLKSQNKQSLKQFYDERIAPMIKTIFQQQFKIPISEPVEVILKNEFSTLLANTVQGLNEKKKVLENKRSQLLRQDQPLGKIQNKQKYNTQRNDDIEAFNMESEQFSQLLKQIKEIQQQKVVGIIQNLVQHFIKNKMIFGNGLSFSNNITQEATNFLASSNLNPLFLILFHQSVEKTVEKAQSKYNGSQKFFSTLLKQSYELQVLDEIMKYIFQQKMQKEEKKILQKLK